MISRRLPQSDIQRSKALRACAKKAASTPLADWLITPAQNVTLQGTLSPWRNARTQSLGALNQQVSATTECQRCLNRTTLFISHFLQNLDNAIAREALPASVRTLYGLPAAGGPLPDINTVADALEWAANLAEGEAARIAAGGPPLAWPTIGEVNTENALLETADNTQSTRKDAFDQLQRAIALLRPAVDHLIKDLWDTIEYNLRHEPDHASLRRRAREWGVFYENDPEAEPDDGEDPDTPPDNPPPPGP